MGQKIGIVGGGISGLSLQLALARQGYEASVFERNAQSRQAGADINLTPNAVAALDGLGVGAALRAAGGRPTHRISRDGASGAETSRIVMGTDAERRYGAPQLTLYRADLLGILTNAARGLPGVSERACVDMAEQDGRPCAVFADGTRECFDVVIGADGIHSAVRRAVFGQEHPRFTGLVAYRAVVPAARVGLAEPSAFTKWWGRTPDSQVVAFPIGAHGDVFVFATIAQADWRHESWTTNGHVDELSVAYADYHEEARGLLAGCGIVLKSALYERDAMAHFGRGRVTLMGDAAHAMMPFMAQGAGSAIEDAVVLARCIGESGPGEVALRRYEAARQDRCGRIQSGSRSNAWLKSGGNADWVYGYDAWATPLPAVS